VLAVLYCYGSIRKFKTRELRIEIAMKNTIVLISYGALIEVLQMYVFTWRSGEFSRFVCRYSGRLHGDIWCFSNF
jgi:hypothetical protein